MFEKQFYKILMDKLYGPKERTWTWTVDGGDIIIIDGDKTTRLELIPKSLWDKKDE